MNQFQKIIKNLTFTVIVLGVCFGLCLIIDKIFQTYSPISALFALAVFFVSLYTEGYTYGVIASLLSVLALNFAFTFPYFKFNFSIPENMVSAVIMLSITIVSSTLTTKIRNAEKLQIETEKEKMRANLLRAVSHDLRSPLTTIYGSSSLIVESYDNLSKQQILQLVTGMKEDSHWLIRMVENLLSITKVDGSNVKLNKNPAVLEELVDTVIKRFKKRYPNQKIKVQIPDEFIMIPMDVLLIEQVIINLLENAVQHAVGLTEIIFNVYIKSNTVYFEVIDDGCGISKDQLDKIFTGYHEKKSMPADSRKSSMGIGLSVCASIINAHEGRISAENIEPKGTKFCFSLKTEENIDEY